METGPKAAAFFDMDGTLLRGESQFSFLFCCLQRGIAPPFRTIGVAVQYAAYLLGFLHDAKELRVAGFGLLARVQVNRLEKTGEDFFDSKLLHNFRRHAFDLVAAHKNFGNIVVLVTSACEPVALPVAKKFGFDAVISTRLLARNGIYTGERDLPEPYGSGKRTLVEQFCQKNSICPSECFAYGDHHTDAPLLEFVGHPVAANPTRKLESIAHSKSWPIVDLDSLAEFPVAFPHIAHSC